MGNERMKMVLEWYLDHKDSDSNMYELVEVMCQASREEELNRDALNMLSGVEVERLFSRGIVKTEDDPLVQMVMEIRAKILKGEKLSEAMEDFAKMLVGITFYLRTVEARTGQKAEYANRDEYVRLLDSRDAVLDAGEKLTPVMQRNLDFVSVHYKNDHYRLPDRHASVNAWANERSNNTQAKLLAMISAVEPYMYPPKVQDMMSMIDGDSSLSGVDFDLIRDLGMGKDFNEIYQKLESSNMSGLGLGLALNNAAMYAKRGPEFWLFAAERIPYTPTVEDLQYIEQLKQENMELEKQYPTDSTGQYTA